MAFHMFSSSGMGDAGEPPGVDGAGALEQFMADASALVDALQSVAVTVKDRASEAKRRLGVMEETTEDGTIEKGHPALRVTTRLLNARLRETLDALVRAREIADSALLARHREMEGGAGAEPDVERARGELRDLLEEVQEENLLGGVPELPGAPAGAREAADVAARVAVEGRAPRGGNEQEEDVGPATADSLAALRAGELAAHDLAALRAVTRALREAERDVNARAALAAETKALGGGDEYTEENFAYGSTPLSTWLALIGGCPELADQMHALANREGPGAAPGTPAGYAVWGSSSGWMVFYAALGLGVRSIGYELLRCHVDTANEAAAAAAVLSPTGGRLATFVCGDMLEAPLGEGVRVVVLTSQCWDRGLHDRAAKRLAEGLTAGALVVDYGPRLADEEAFGEPIATLTLPVSWNSGQKFYVFRRRDDDDKSTRDAGASFHSE